MTFCAAVRPLSLPGEWGMKYRGGFVMSLYMVFAVLAVLPQPHRETPPISPTRLEDRVIMPYVDLMEPATYSHDEIGSLRSNLEHERDEKIKVSNKTEKHWKSELDAARAELDEINRRGSVDTPGNAARRSQLHVDIAALERGIREMAEQQKTTIPADYNKQLTKLWLIERWPEERKDIARHIDQGESRKRPHGDVEDIGFRSIAKNPTEDIEVGKQAVRQMTAGGWLPAELQDEKIQNYVRHLADRIAVNSDLKVPLHVTMVDSSDLKVTALPGGFLYVTSGVMRATQTESEFAGVLSREIARIAARHAARASKHSIVSRMFLPIAQIATGFFSPGLNQAAYYGIGYGMQGLSGVMDHMLEGAVEKYQKEADQLGVQYAWKAGFDPRGSIEFLESLNGNTAMEFLAPTPVLMERLLNMFSEIEYLGPLPNEALDSPEFQATRERLQSEIGPPVGAVYDRTYR
jgi:hypothetical protein